MLKNLITQVGPCGFMKLKIKVTKLLASLQTFQCHSQHLRNMYKVKEGNSYALKYH